MSDKKSNSLHVGLFLVIGFILFVAGILILGGKRNMFQPSIRITTVFSDVKGLKVGNNVRFTGIEVGAIVDVNIISDTAVAVVMALDKDVVKYIKKNSRATIGSDGLMGSKIIIILPGTPDADVVETGDIIPSLEPVEMEDIISDIQGTSEKISMVADNLVEITDKMNRGEGLFGKVFNDSEFSLNIEKSGENISILSENLVKITNKLSNGESLLGKILVDPEFAGQWEATTENIMSISVNLQELSEKINRGDGVLAKLLTDTAMAGNFFNASQDLETVLHNLSEVSMKLNDERNALHKFIADTAFADSVELLLNRVNEGIIEVTAAAETLQNSRLLGGSSKKNKKKNEKNKSTE